MGFRTRDFVGLGFLARALFARACCCHVLLWLSLSCLFRVVLRVFRSGAFISLGTVILLGFFPVLSGFFLFLRCAGATAVVFQLGFSIG